MGKCGREEGCDLCAHEVDLHKAFAILTGPRPDIVEVTRQAELFFFFPRVRTPCGHGAQVIVEGREEQTDGGERNEDPKTNQPKPNTQARRPKLHHLVVFPLH